MERLEAWFDAAAIRDDVNGPLFRATATARAKGREGFRWTPLSRRGVQYLVTDKVAQWAAWIASWADQLDPLVEAEPSILDLSFEEYEQRIGGLETSDSALSKPPAR